MLLNILTGFFAGLALGLGIMTYVMGRMRKQFQKTNDTWSEACRSWMSLYYKVRDEMIVVQTLMRANMPADEEVPEKRLLN